MLVGGDTALTASNSGFELRSLFSISTSNVIKIRPKRAKLVFGVVLAVVVDWAGGLKNHPSHFKLWISSKLEQNWLSWYTGVG